MEVDIREMLGGKKCNVKKVYECFTMFSAVSKITGNVSLFRN